MNPKHVLATALACAFSGSAHAVYCPPIPTWQIAPSYTAISIWPMEQKNADGTYQYNQMQSFFWHHKHRLEWYNKYTDHLGYPGTPRGVATPAGLFTIHTRYYGGKFSPDIDFLYTNLPSPFTEYQPDALVVGQWDGDYLKENFAYQVHSLLKGPDQMWRGQHSDSNFQVYVRRYKRINPFPGQSVHPLPITHPAYRPPCDEPVVEMIPPTPRWDFITQCIYGTHGYHGNAAGLPNTVLGSATPVNDGPVEKGMFSIGRAWRTKIFKVTTNAIVAQQRGDHVPNMVENVVRSCPEISK